MKAWRANLSSLALCAFGLGCGAAPPPPPPPVATVAEAPPPPPAPPNRCASLFGDEPEPPEVPAPPLSPVCADNAAGERAMRERLAREYHIRGEPSRVDVAFDCDPVQSEVRALEVVQELDYGGASHFSVARFDRPEEGDVRVRAIRMDLPTVRGDEMTWQNAVAGELTRFVGTIPRAELDRLLPSLRAGIVGRTREVELPHAGGDVVRHVGRVGAVETPFSMRIVDADGNALARRGITSTSGPRQREWLGPTLASRDLWDLLEVHASWERAAPEPADAEFVQAALVGHRDAAPYDGPAFFALQLRLSIPLSAAALLAPLAPIDPEEGVEPSGPMGVRLSFHDRLRAIVIEELARRTGWDARRAADGSARMVTDVANDYLEECARASRP